MFALYPNKSSAVVAMPARARATVLRALDVGCAGHDGTAGIPMTAPAASSIRVADGLTPNAHKRAGLSGLAPFFHFGLATCASRTPRRQKRPSGPAQASDKNQRPCEHGLPGSLRITGDISSTKRL
jgi:hypothetical protein